MEVIKQFSTLLVLKPYLKFKDHHPKCQNRFSLRMSCWRTIDINIDISLTHLPRYVPHWGPPGVHSRRPTLDVVAPSSAVPESWRCGCGRTQGGDHDRWEVVIRMRLEDCGHEWFIAGWWFGTFFMFPYIGNNHSSWLIFFRGVQTTNQVGMNDLWWSDTNIY